MKVLVNIPKERYDQLVSACDIKSLEYHLLKNGLITRAEDRANNVTVQILTDSEPAQRLLAWANGLFPDSARQIRVVQNHG